MKTLKANPPMYSQIALDIATRIARGDIKVNTKVYGRSVMSSEYGVSPETIRKAMKLLEDMQIVEIKHNSGVVVLSSEKANQFVERFYEQSSIRSMLNKLEALMTQQETVNQQISEVVGAIVRINERSTKNTPFISHEIKVPQNSPLIGFTLDELKFFHQTSATVIAIKREESIILSPGPLAVLYPNDTLIFVGDIPSIEAVYRFVEG